jgi:hypothetical protein
MDVNLWFGGPCDPGNPCAGARAGAEGRADGLQDGAIETGTRVGRGVAPPVAVMKQLPGGAVDRRKLAGSERERLGFGRVWVRLVFAPAQPHRVRQPAPRAARRLIEVYLMLGI